MQSQKGFSIAIALVLLLGLVSIATIVGAYYFIDKARNNAFEENIVILNTLQRLDAKWSENILKTRDYTLQDFDQLTHSMAKISEALSTLDQRGMLDEKRVGKATVKQYQVYKDSFTLKNEAVEFYKSQHAILRNAVRYLPKAGENIQHALTEAGNQDNKKITGLLMSSHFLTQQYLLNLTDAPRVKQTLSKLEQYNAGQSNNIQDQVRGYLTHSRLIVKYKPKAEEMLTMAMSVDISALSASLVNEYAKFQDHIKQNIEHLQHVMLIGVVMLLVLILWFLQRLRKSAAKILQAHGENKVMQQKLLQTEDHLRQVNQEIIQIGRRSAAGELSLNTFKALNIAMPAFSSHLGLLNNLKINGVSSEYKREIDPLITDMEGVYHNIDALSRLIDPQKNKEREVNFDFNYIIQSAFDQVILEVDSSVKFNKQLSAVPPIQASSIDVYQIAKKLLHQSATVWQRSEESIFVKTWATGHYANLCLSILGYDNLDTLYAEDALADLHTLLDQNAAILKLTPRDDGKSAIIWVSFPYQK